MLLSRLSRWCYEHRRRVLFLWIGAFILINVAGGAIGNRYTNNLAGGHSDSMSAYNLLKSKFPARAGDTADIVFTTPAGVRDQSVRAALEGLFAEVGPGRSPHVVALDSPYSAPGRISGDGRIGYATVTYDKQAGEMPVDTGNRLIDAVRKVHQPGLRIELDGPVIALADQKSPGASEGIGILAAMIILFLAFGSLIAMSLPVIAAIAGVGIGIVFVSVLSHAMTVPSFAPYVAIMIGLGVGIDYALFIVVRYRNGLHDGLDPEAADVAALTTAGRAVLFAGSTVIVSLFGMFMMGISFIYGLSVGAILAVLMTMLASVTLVPAVIGFAGTKLAAREHKRTAHRETLAFRWSRAVQHRPVVAGAAAVVVLLVLAVPLLSIRLGVADQGNDPTSMTTRQAYDLLAKGFGPGFNGPVILAGQIGGSTTVGQVQQLAAQVRQDPDVAFVAPLQVSPAGDAVSVVVVPKGSPQDVSTGALVHRLRADVTRAGLVVHVGGLTAGGIDAARSMGKRLPLMVAAVIVLSFLLLMTAFRSLVIAAKAAVMNLLSIGAAYGVVVAVFQWGWLSSVVGIGRPGPIEFWVPMMMFTILFGLSMDYEVFLLSRIREEYLTSGDTSSAVADGVSLTARIITAAAAIMAAVFLSFVLGDQRVLKLMGLGLATAVIIDATLVRMVLVPSVMQLLGRVNWWMPAWLDTRLPKLTIDTAAPPEVPVAEMV